MRALSPLALLLSLVATSGGCPLGTCEEGLVRDDADNCVLPAPDACDDGTLAILGEAECAPVGWTVCGDAFRESDEGCVDACDGADRDSPACRAAGAIPCADGFAPADVGCEPVFPTTACADGTRAVLGAEACVPLGDCDAPFPPAGATRFVDDSFADDALDATHHRTLTDALAAAAAGDVIAVESGTYAEAIVMPAGVSVVGRCAAEVILEGPGNPGVGVTSTAGVVLSNVTVRGFNIGVQAEHGSEVLLEEVLIEENQTVGVFVLDPGTEVTIRRSAIRDSLPDGGTFGTGVGVGFGGHLILEDSVISGSQDMGILVDGAGSRATVSASAVVDTSGRANGTLGWGVAIQDGGSAEITGSLVRESRNVGVNVVDGASAVLRGSVIDATRSGVDANDEGLAIGIGVNVQLASSLVLEDVTLRANTAYGVRAGEAGTTADLRGVVIDGVLPAVDDGLSIGAQIENGADVELAQSFVYNPHLVGGPLAAGIMARAGGTARLFDVTVAEASSAGILTEGDGTVVEAERLLVRDTNTPDPDFGYGLFFSFGARLEATDVNLLRNASSAVVVDAASAVLHNTDIRATVPSGAGRGRGISAQFGATLELADSRLTDNAQVGVMLFGDGTNATVTRTLVRGTTVDPAGEHGHGVEVLAGAVARVARSELSANEGVGAIFADAGGVLEATRLLDNRVGIHAFDGATLEEAAAAPDELPARAVVVVGSEFSGNETRVGSGSVPLPDPAKGRAR